MSADKTAREPKPLTAALKRRIKNKELVAPRCMEPQSVTAYQRKNRPTLYAMVVRRRYIAFAASRPVGYNANLGPQHHKAADKVLHHQYNTRNLALQLDRKDDFVVSSDTSFGDSSV